MQDEPGGNELPPHWDHVSQRIVQTCCITQMKLGVMGFAIAKDAGA